MTVYFITEKGRLDSPIKIGTTDNLARRFEDLQKGSPVDLEVVAALEGGRSLELFFHELLASDRIRGEWFIRSEQVSAVVDAARRCAPKPTPGRPRKSNEGMSPERLAIATMCRAIAGAIAPAQSTRERCQALVDRLQPNLPGVTAGRVKSLYFREARRIDAAEARAISDLHTALHLGDAR